MQAVKGRSMEKGLCWGSIGVGAFLFLLFLLNMIIKIPFGAGIPLYVHIVILAASGVLIYLGLNALRDLP
jgi:hypothetical protein